jgi:hypothetical protein
MPVHSQTDLANDLFKSYDSYKVGEITSRRFTQEKLLHWLKPFGDKGLFETEPLGTSAEGRTISLLKLGNGSKKVFLWSQMHGDESTATMALLDLFAFLSLHPAHEATTSILRNLNLLVLPMLNPDGAERFQRRTSQEIDMNRDALALVTPEARILKETRDRYRPEYGFNLHDQDPRFTVGSTKNVTTIALLAPALNEERSDNAVRIRAKHVAAVAAEVLQQIIPGHVAKYDDTFEPRAFGDNIQRWGTSTVLVESGGWPGDRDKMFIRKLNCVALLTTLVAISGESYAGSDIGIYERLPLNSKNLYDLIVRGARVQTASQGISISADIAFNVEEQVDKNSGAIQLIGKIVDLGDLTTYGSFEEIQAGGMVLDYGKIYLDAVYPLEEIRRLFR